VGPVRGGMPPPNLDIFQISTRGAAAEAISVAEEALRAAEQTFRAAAVRFQDLPKLTNAPGVGRQRYRVGCSVDAFLTGVDVFSFDTTAAAKFGTVGAALAGTGVPIGQMDALIAAHALSVGATLVTNNEKHFSRVPGLKVESWT
jgi:predicted nucleic acid-binding protein